MYLTYIFLMSYSLAIKKSLVTQNQSDKDYILLQLSTTSVQLSN